MVNLTLKDEVKTRLLIAETGSSLRGFSKNVGVSHAYVSQILSGKRKPSPTIASKIARGLDKKIEEIFLIKVVENNNRKSEEVN
ncbi:hypothetical protein GCM10011409_20130 [Lentibacillus populi]|uniref:HTH cro/C1-type domain-containing protein n=1 Tax=Lentibacillus populi TaxID=1827502 RepID=A0A9W5TXY2_9BACI|nr:helix-turn-helix transcriptional regulator [Lentibacillus populi]GGB42532.1 hypothetical protein GCM10011409_20130 [Lentibacillus populi]